MATKRLSGDVLKYLKDCDLEGLAPKLEALGVRGVTDLALVDDADLVRWGLSTIERRRFFGKVRKVLGTGDDFGAALLPPSALTQAPHAAKARQQKRRQDTQSVGPARLDELLGRGSAEHQVPRLAERMLAATGPIDVPDLAERLARTAPALAQGYNATEWPQFVEACCRGYGRLQVEDGVLAGDKPIVSICSTVLFAASEEVVADTACWVRVVTCLATPKQVAIITAVCRASREVADGPEVWGKLLMRWYPKATLLNPDWVAQDELEKKLEEALNNDYALAALRMRLDVDTPYDISELMNVLPQQTTPKALVKFMSTHQEMFRQSPDGKKFCISKAEGQADLKTCKGWRTVNPFQTPSLPAAGSAAPAGGSSKTDSAPKPPPPGRPTALSKQDKEDRQAANEAAKAPGAAPAPEAPPAPNVCQRLDPKQAFRLYHSGLLSQRTDQSKRGKLEAWEYYTESNSKCVMAAGDLLDLAETRTNSIRMNDPAVVHELVSQTLEGVVYKVPFGFWNRRVRILTSALNASQLRVGREQRKKFERKLVEFMEWVKKERGFGYYQCEACGSRWRSGFSYEEIQQQCLGCGAWAKPYRIQDLESPAAREAREKGEPIPEEEKKNNKGKGRGVTKWQQPLVEAAVPTIQHQQQGRLYPYQTMKRPWMNQQGGPPPQRPRYSENDAPMRPGKAYNWTPSPKETARDPVFVSPRPKGAPMTQAPKFAAAPPPPKAEPAKAAPKPAAPKPAAATPAAAKPAAAEPAARYEPGKGGFFARKSAAAAVAASAAGSSDSAAAAPAAASSSAAPAAASSSSAPAAASSSSAPAAASSSAASSSAPASEAAAAAPEAGAYKPGGGGFFARKKAAEAAAKAAAEAEAAAKAAAEQAKKEPAPAAKKEAAPAVDLGLTPEEMAAMGLTGGGSSSSSSGGGSSSAKPASAPAAAAEPETYKSGAGGFFARKRAAAAASAAAAGDAKPAEAAAPKKEPAKDKPSSEPAKKQEDKPSAEPTKSQDAGDDLSHIPADKLMALKTLGLSLEEAVKMGIISADMAKKPVKSAEELKKQREEEKHEALDDAAKQLAERRKAQVARFAAAKAGKKEEEAVSNLPKEKEAPSAADAIQVTCTDEVFVDAIKAVVWFLDEETGGARVITAQASDASFLVSDLVFWPMLRRLGAEVIALEAKAGDLGGQWANAPSSAEGAIAFAEERGYMLPEGLSEPTASAIWRRAMLVEVATELMMARLQEGRGFMDIPALAGPAKSAAQNGGTWDERPVEDEAGLDDVTRATKLVGDLSTASGAQAPASSDLAVRLTSVADAKPVAAAGPGSRADVPALTGRWNLLQEMGVREAAGTLKQEYASRRTILLHRLDVSVQAIFASKESLPEGARRKAADTLSSMWAGWRRGAAKAQHLSEWDALAATKGMLARAVAARVSGPTARVKSKIKHVRIGAVPDRGGIPDGYCKDKSGQKPTGSSSASAPAAPAPQAPAASQPGGAPRQRTGKSAIKETPAPAASSSSEAGAAAASSSSAGEAPAASSAADGSSAAAGEKPAAKEETVGAKPETKTVAGMRSTNKEGEKEYRAQKKKEHEQGGRISSYYEELTKARGQ